jgi:transcriptional regulator with XRE-family HTH domain
MADAAIHGTVADNVRTAMTAGGITSEEAAAQCGLDPENFGHRLTGQAPFTVGDLFHLAAVAGVTAATLVTGI